MNVALGIFAWVALVIISMANEWWWVAAALNLGGFLLVITDGGKDISTGVKIIGGMILIGVIIEALQSKPPFYY